MCRTTNERACMLVYAPVLRLRRSPATASGVHRLPTCAGDPGCETTARGAGGAEGVGGSPRTARLPATQTRYHSAGSTCISFPATPPLHKQQ